MTSTFIHSTKKLLVPTSKDLFTRYSPTLQTVQFSSTHAPQYTLPDLPYDYAALEPAIGGKIMETHHKKHHQTYVNNLNNALQQFAEAESKNDLTKMLSLQSAIKFNGGGHFNHSIFWTNLAPVSAGGGAPPTGPLLTAIERDFGSVENLKSQLTAASLGIQGSGWGWLGYNKANGKLEIYTKPNQDPLTEATPLLGIDVWEHAYYYTYGPARAEYLKNFWNITNWKNVAERFAVANSK
jgi:Fe-Mn family superoxide dismutase